MAKSKPEWIPTHTYVIENSDTKKRVKFRLFTLHKAKLKATDYWPDSNRKVYMEMKENRLFGSKSLVPVATYNVMLNRWI